MDYIVSARKYRPMTFDSVVGQSALTTTLKNAVKSQKLAHAYLFCGPRGVGKTTCARIFAKAINCEHPTSEGEACNECESCRAFNEQRSYNIFELDAASNNSVDNIKTLMEQTRIAPQIGRYKVFIIDEVHMLSTAAFNAFLKTLEEPPAHVIFILATTEKHKILPTIISRCQIYDFERMSVPSIISHLKMVAEKEQVSYEEEALNVIAEKADGGMRDALSIFDQAVSFCQGNITYQKVIEDLNVLDSEYYFRIIDLSLQNKVAEVMVLLNDIINKGFDGGHLINGMAQHVRNVLMAKDAQTIPLLEVSQRQAERFKQQAQMCPTPFLYRALKIMNQCDQGYRQSSNKRLLVELTLIQIAQLTQPDDDGVSAGRSPKRLKSLFRKLVSNVQPKAVSQGAAAGRKMSETKGTCLPEQGAVSDNSENKHTISSEEVSSITSPSQSVPVSSPRVRLNSLGMSFKNMLHAEKMDGADSFVEEKETSSANVEDKTVTSFTEEELGLEWMAMCNRMPQSMAGMAARMKNMRPRITKFPAIEAVVDNEFLLNQLTAIKGRIRSTLVKALHNEDITFTLRLTEGAEVKKVLSRREQFEEMEKNNPALGMMCQLFDLELA